MRATTIFFHRSKEDNRESGAAIKLNPKQMENFVWVGAEVSVIIQVDDDGNAWATHLNGNLLREKVRI